ncbi:MAG: M20 family metallopeptidase [Campylobacteraceae bacterium]|nr:M20 family metallopeptidase [Campylobacteraceae bacterium]
MKNFDELKKLIEINSYTKNKKGVDENAKIYKAAMRELGFTCKEYERDEIGNHIIFKSNKKGGKKLLLLGHMDTVFPEGSFYGFREDEEWIYGPGVCDMKGGNIVAIEALRNIYKKYGEIYNIDLMLASDEESGSDDSKYVTASVAKNYDYCMVYEAAGKNLEIVVARKGAGTFYLDIEGKAAHAGNNYKLGIDANLEAAYKIQELIKLTNLNKGTTVNVGKIEGGVGANTISPCAKLTFEVRYTCIKERDRILKEIDGIIKTSYGKGISSYLSGGIQRDVMEENDKQKNFVNNIENYTGEKLLREKRGGVSDANIVSSQGTPTLDGFGPFGDGDHTSSERALKSSFIQRINLSTKIFEGLLEGKI